MGKPVINRSLAGRRHTEQDRAEQARREFELTQALRNMIDAGLRPPCCNPGAGHLSEQPDERARAARLCSICPAQPQCKAAAEEAATFGVWGSQDFTTATRGN